MKFGFIVKHRGTWPVDVLCDTLGVSRSGFMRGAKRRCRCVRKWMTDCSSRGERVLWRVIGRTACAGCGATCATPVSRAGVSALHA